MTTSQVVRSRAGTRRPRAARVGLDAPWAPGDRVIAGCALALGVGLIVLAWAGASDTTDWDTQLRWTACSIVGVVVSCVGVGIWLFRGFGRVRVEARAVRGALLDRLARNAAPVPTATEAVRVTVAGMTHHHRPDCPLVIGKATVAAQESALLVCGVCA